MKPTPNRPAAASRLRLVRDWGVSGEPWKAEAPSVNGAHPRDRPIFTFMTARELAQPVAPVQFYIQSVLAKDTFGPNAGAKKSLKTHTNLALGAAAASGRPLFNFDQFKVPKPVPVLYIVGEGGNKPFRRLLRRVCAAYGAELEELPLFAMFGTAPMDDTRFVDELKRGLDLAQPAIVVMESFYNFHPAIKDTGNLYSRGQAIAEYHGLVRAELVDATSLLTDHFRSTGVTELDLDSISMSGQAENADSWIMLGHREPPSIETGEFRLVANFGSRQGFGRFWNVDWHCGVFDDELGDYVGGISWDVSPADEETKLHRPNKASGRGGGGSPGEIERCAQIAVNVMQAAGVDGVPSGNQMEQRMGKVKTDNKRNGIDLAVARGQIVVKEGAGARGGKLYLPGPNLYKFKLGADSEGGDGKDGAA